MLKAGATKPISVADLATFRDGHTELAADSLSREYTGEFVLQGSSPAAAGGGASQITVPQAPYPRASCDVHFHPQGYDQRGPGLREIGAMMDQRNVQYLIASGIPTTATSLQSDAKYVRHGFGCGERYYLLPDDFDTAQITPEMISKTQAAVELTYDPAVDYNLAAEHAKLPAALRERILLGLTGVNLGDPRSKEWLLKILNNSLSDFSVLGEITLQKEMVKYLIPNQSQADLKGHIEPFISLIQLVGSIGMTMILHCDVDSSIQEEIKEGKPLYRNAMDRLLSDPRTAGTNIVWAHLGGLNRFGVTPVDHFERLDDLLSRHAHLRVDLSWSRVAQKLTPAETTALAKLIVKHPDRFLMGSDALAPTGAAVLGQTFDIYAQRGGLFDQIRQDNEEALEAVLNSNFKNVILASRENVRMFKTHVLPEVMPLITSPRVDGLKPAEIGAFAMQVYKDRAPDHYIRLDDVAKERKRLQQLSARAARKASVGSESSEENTGDQPAATRTKLNQKLTRLSRAACGTQTLSEEATRHAGIEAVEDNIFYGSAARWLPRFTDTDIQVSPSDIANPVGGRIVDVSGYPDAAASMSATAMRAAERRGDDSDAPPSKRAHIV